MQKKTHAMVAKAAKPWAVNVVFSPVLHSLFGELFSSAILFQTFASLADFA